MFGAKGRKVGKKEMKSRRNIYTCIFEKRYMKMEKERNECKEWRERWGQWEGSLISA